MGYALSGGAARGLAHIGVLKVLDEYGVCPDVIAGTSMGAIIGALYAGGLKATDIEQLALGLDWKSMADITLPLSGLIQGKRVVSLLESILGRKTFSELKCDFACVTTDILTGQQVVLREGSLIEALRATISIPGIFTPVLIGERYLVDGGLVNEVPVSVCREMGADFVIGVNVIPEPGSSLRKSEPDKSPQTHQLSNRGSTVDEGGLDTPSDQPGRSLRARLDDIESSIRTFLQLHQSREPESSLKPADSLQAEKARHPHVKSPSLIEVLSHTVTIAEYRVAVENLKGADVAISPDTGDIGFWHFEKAAQAISVGEQATRRLPQLASVI